MVSYQRNMFKELNSLIICVLLKGGVGVLAIDFALVGSTKQHFLKLFMF